MTKIHRFTNQQKRLPQFILALDSQYYEQERVVINGSHQKAFLDSINHFPYELFCENVQSYLVIREREYLDETNAVHHNASPFTSTDPITKKGDPHYKQLLPYMIARQLQDDGSYLYFPYRRTKKVGESRLAGNGSLGYGGHIDLDDVVSTNSIIDLKATILKSAAREAIEEFTMYDETGLKCSMVRRYHEAISFGDLFIADNSNDVGELHLGIIMYFDVPQGWKLEATEDELAKLPPMSAEQMLNDPEFKPENWTRIYLESILQVTQFDYAELCAGGKDATVIDSPVGNTAVSESSLQPAPNPTEDDLRDPVFNAIYQAAKDWDVNSPKHYVGYCGFNGSHAKVILDAVRNVTSVGSSNILAIDHGGEKVGEVDQSYFAKAVAEYNPSDYVTLDNGRSVLVSEIIDQQVYEGVGRDGPYPGVKNFKDYLPKEAVEDTLNTAELRIPKGVISTIPDDMMKAFQKTGNVWNGNNVDWNNTLTGSPANVVDLNVNELRNGLAATNAVDISAESKDKSSY